MKKNDGWSMVVIGLLLILLAAAISYGDLNTAKELNANAENICEESAAQPKTCEALLKAEADSLQLPFVYISAFGIGIVAGATSVIAMQSEQPSPDE